MSIYIAMCIYWKIWSIAEVFNTGHKMGNVFPPACSAKLKVIYG